MRIEKAIEILQARLDIPFIGKNPDTKAAIRLGIEALERVKVNRGPIRAHWREPLLGETEE